MQIITENSILNNQPTINPLDHIKQTLKDSRAKTNKLNEQISDLTKQESELKEARCEVSKSIDLAKGLIDHHAMNKPATFTEIKNLFLRFDANTFDRWIKKMDDYEKELDIKQDKNIKIANKLTTIADQKDKLENKKKEFSLDFETYEKFKEARYYRPCDITNLLYSCAETDNVDLMKFLFIGYKELIDINYQPENEYGEMGNSLLMTAMSYKSLKMVKFLLNQEGIDVNAKEFNDETALDQGIDEGFTAGVEFMLKHQKSQDLNKDSLKNAFENFFVYWSGKNVQTEIFKLLWNFETVSITGKKTKIKHWIVNEEFWHGRNIVHFVCDLGNVAVAKMVFGDHEIFTKLDFWKKDNYNMTPAFIAKYKGHTEILKMVERAIANIFDEIARENTPTTNRDGDCVLD